MNSSLYVKCVMCCGPDSTLGSRVGTQLERIWQRSGTKCAHIALIRRTNSCLTVSVITKLLLDVSQDIESNIAALFQPKIPIKHLWLSFKANTNVSNNFTELTHLLAINAKTSLTNGLKVWNIASVVEQVLHRLFDITDTEHHFH